MSEIFSFYARSKPPVIKESSVLNCICIIALFSFLSGSVMHSTIFNFLPQEDVVTVLVDVKNMFINNSDLVDYLIPPVVQLFLEGGKLACMTCKNTLKIS